jgi:hypothetical protein
MLVGVISDTHFPDKVAKLSEKIEKIFSDVDLIIHAGDIHSDEVLKELSAIAPVVAVAGNGDSAKMAYELGQNRVVYINGYKVGIAHGHHGDVCESGIARSFAWFEEADLVIGGHTHLPSFENTVNGIYLNPGSCGVPKDPRGSSVALLTLDQDIDAKIIFLDEVF